MTELASVVLFATDPTATAAFYRALGVVLEDEHHGEGAIHFATELGPVHFAIYPAETPGRSPQRRHGGSVFPGFYVDSLEHVVSAVLETGAPILAEHEQMDWGCRVLVEDPDGRTVEINQRAHCPG
jgi:lactoylglutathione lyase